ncbi:MAG: hypothetical protein KKE11_04155 [Gammaproteobacteria bacterium]|nr:hypothetical protein [Gammaproteobacteria bacterium]
MSNKKLSFCLIFLILVLFWAETIEAKEKIEQQVVNEAKKTTRKTAGKIEYIGHKTNRDPFGLPPELVKILEAAKSDPGAKVVQVPNVELQGIIWSASFPQVIINNSVMAVGDKIGDFEIQQITRNGIILFYKGQTIPIKIEGYKRRSR